MSATCPKRLRWKLWNLLTLSRRVCPANAYTVIIGGERGPLLVDHICRTDCARNGECWCGNLKAGAS